MRLPTSLHTLLIVLLLGSLSCAALFAAPNPAKPVPQQSTVTTVPFDYDPILRPYIVVQASINGNPPLPFVVDTGTFNLLLSVEPWAAKKLALPVLATQKSQSVLGQAGQYTVQNTIIKTIKILGDSKSNTIFFRFNPPKNWTASKQKTPFQVVDVLSPVSDYYRVPQLAGIIPCNLLSVHGEIWQIDFQRKLLTFTVKTKDWKPLSGSAVVPLQAISTGGYSLRAGPASGKLLNFLVDTGNPSTSAQFLAALPLPVGQSAQTLTHLSSRRYTYDTVLLPQLQIGSLQEPDVALSETNPGSATASPNILGTDFLSRFLVTLDFADNKIYLKRRSDYASLIVPPGRANVRLEKQGTHCIAAWVQPDSPAELAGLHSGDQIAAVDRQSFEDVPLNAAQNLLDGQEGTRANLQVVTADKKSANVSFTRSPKFLGRRHALLGVSVEWVQGYLMVAGVTPGSPLDGTLKFNDDIDSLNGQSVSKMTMDDALRLLERPDLALQVWRSSDKTWHEVHIAPLAAQTQVLAGPPPAGTQYRYYDKAGWTAVPLP